MELGYLKHCRNNSKKENWELLTIVQKEREFIDISNEMLRKRRHKCMVGSIKGIKDQQPLWVLGFKE